MNAPPGFRPLEVHGVVYPPNKPMIPRKEFSKSPVVYDHLFFIDFNETGNCILGSSQVAGTFWEGTLLYFETDERMNNFDYTGYYIYSTHSDGKFLTENTIAVAEDSGNLNVLSLDKDTRIRTINYFKLVERIPQIAVWKNSSRILGCAGRSISIWDADSLDRKPIEQFDNYHLENITCVDTVGNNTNLFLSGARDRIACIWDLRNPEPSCALYTNEFSSITSISWNQDNDNYVIVGTQAGDVYLVDKREPKDFVSVLHCFNSPINRISFNSSKESAVCGDTNDVLIISSENNCLEVAYKSSEHKGHVKGLKWYNGTLYSCGFGKQVLKHVRPALTEEL